MALRRGRKRNSTTNTNGESATTFRQMLRDSSSTTRKDSNMVSKNFGINIFIFTIFLIIICNSFYCIKFIGWIKGRK